MAEPPKKLRRKRLLRAVERAERKLERIQALLVMARIELGKARKAK